MPLMKAIAFSATVTPCSSTSHREPSLKFELLQEDGKARRARMSFARGEVETPVFMPVGTYGTVKAMTPEELSSLGSQIVLAFTVP